MRLFLAVKIFCLSIFCSFTLCAAAGELSSLSPIDDTLSCSSGLNIGFIDCSPNTSEGKNALKCVQGKVVEKCGSRGEKCNIYPASYSEALAASTKGYTLRTCNVSISISFIK